MRDMWRIQFILILFCIALQYNLADKPPNVVVIFTDEHNFRTLGCYRDQMDHEQAFIWGKGVKVNTPNIDALAEEGALFTNFNVVAPLCTPSRASFMTGLYPWFTGAWKNHTPMNKGTVTWAEVLKKKAGHHTGYIGKWHLNGEAKPEFANFKRRFGFNDIKYMYNRGHWKFFEEGDEGLNVFDATTFKQFQGREEEHYATDFLFKKAQDFMRKQIKKEQHFALMLSIPDPHGPNDVREPYSTMFKRMKFKLPKTARAAYHKEPALPHWSTISTDIAIADQTIAAIEEDEKWQTRNQQYFGMVRLIDDKVGELMSFLKETGQDKNTIIVFTSDHGDMMGEHAKYNKGKPYMTSAGVPFIIRYPGHIRKGKIVKTAYSSPDFAPTLFSLVGIDHSDVLTQGIDGSDELFNRKLINERKQVRLMTDSKQSIWAAAVDRQYKLVVSRSSPPYLFDMKEDPDEVVNYYEDPRYNNITSELKNELYEGIAKYNLPLATSPVFFFDTPLCFETQDQIPALPNKVCTDLKIEEHSDSCEIEEVNSFCTEACDICCDDSSGVISNYGKLISCDDVKNNTEYCIETQIARFCPLTCMECIPKPSSKPSDAPSFSLMPSISPTVNPSLYPTQSNRPTSIPSDTPSIAPSNTPTMQPSETFLPSTTPSIGPSESLNPSSFPSSNPTSSPSTSPSITPSNRPTVAPSYLPTIVPTAIPTSEPSTNPSPPPSDFPTIVPTTIPTSEPSIIPSSIPTELPTTTSAPSVNPSHLPSDLPTIAPTTIPTSEPSVNPSPHPSDFPTIIPSRTPSNTPSTAPSNLPSSAPTAIPTSEPSVNPSSIPTDLPTTKPSDTPSMIPSNIPSVKPSNLPTVVPTVIPTSEPSINPSPIPTEIPTTKPSEDPSKKPSNIPSTAPSNLPTVVPTTIPTSEPSVNPSSIPTDLPTTKPSDTPSIIPSNIPSTEPSNLPTWAPTTNPTSGPSVNPSSIPTEIPTTKPSKDPSTTPSNIPSTEPSNLPTPAPSTIPTSGPSVNPSSIPSDFPTTKPSDDPSIMPSNIPSTEPSYSPDASTGSNKNNCIDDPDFQFPTNGQSRKCRYITNQIRKDKFCPREINGITVGNACIKSCDLCTNYCRDDPDFLFPANGQSRECRYITNQIRKDKFCPREINGITVGNACIKSCDLCLQ